MSDPAEKAWHEAAGEQEGTYQLRIACHPFVEGVEVLARDLAQIDSKYWRQSLPSDDDFSVIAST